MEPVTIATAIEIKDDETAFPTLYVAVVFGNLRSILSSTLAYFILIIFTGFGEVVEVSIQNGTDVNLNDKNGWIPLHTAAAFGKSMKCHFSVHG